jgi:hypothetical protein
MDDNLNQLTLEAFDKLPRNNDDFFRQLWPEKRLRFEGTEGQTDTIDLHCAQLICTALSQQQPLLIVLPDHAPRRMPLLFITGLVMHTIDFLGKAQNHRVIYFGTSATIKNYLSQTYIRHQKLSDIFNQAHLGRTVETQGDISSNLPYVIFSYAPTNAEKVLETYNPQWVFLDCGDGDNTDWVCPLLDRLAEKKTVVIACVQNPLSNVLDIFQECEWNIFSWAQTPSHSIAQTEITPFVIKSELALTQAEKFQAVSRTLSGCLKQTNGRLQRDAWRTVGRYVRGLENLPVPLQFFEAESKHYWGIHPIQILEQTAMRFVEAVETETIGKALQKVLLEINPVHEQLVENKPPLWLALEQLCIDPPTPEVPTILVFQNRAYRQLFSLAMLAENNIAEHELQTLNVWLVSLKRFVQWQVLMGKMGRTGIDVEGIPTRLKDCYPHWHPIVIGVPTKYNYARYAHLLRHKKMGVLLLPHQIHLAAWHFDQWAARFDQTLPQNLAALRRFIPDPPAHIRLITNRVVSKRIVVSPEQDVLIDDKAENLRTRMSKLFKLASRAEQLAYLMDEFTAQAEANPVADVDMEGADGYSAPSEGAFIDKALIIRFHEKYEAIFSPGDKIQLIVETPGGRDLQERSVRSLRLGDAVLFINGQHRQNLYDLIISRVHDHPTFALHISLIERWQDELVTCFKKARIPLSMVLSQMRAKGSRLQTETAIRFWLWGQVMCPRDAKDLQRIANILDMPFVKQYHRQIDRAASRLRGIHSSLARRLNTWLEQEALSSNPQSFNAVVDEELGLEFKDFQEALMILTVASITEEEGLFLVSDLGWLKAIHY